MEVAGVDKDIIGDKVAPEALRPAAVGTLRDRRVLGGGMLHGGRALRSGRRGHILGQDVEAVDGNVSLPAGLGRERRYNVAAVLHDEGDGVATKDTSMR